jgi:hypothetical protein
MSTFPVEGTVSDDRGYKLPFNLSVSLEGLTPGAEFDINGLTLKADPDEAADFLPIYSAANAGNRKITIGSIDHDALLGFVANEHIDHSTVSIIAGTGLTGGGDLTADRTLTVNAGAIDHGALGGLGDDDHSAVYPAYAQTESITGEWTFTKEINAQSKILIGSPSDETPKRLSSQYDHGSTKANWSAHKLVVSDSMTSALALTDIAYELTYTMSGALTGPVAGFKYGFLVTLNEDATTTDGWSRRAFAAVFNHTNATTGERIAFHSKGGLFVAANAAGTSQWQVDPIPAATASVVQNLATESWADTTVVAVTGSLSRPSTSVVRLNPAGNIILRGILNGGQGNWLWLINVSANTVQISHEDGAATAADRFLTTDTASPVLSANGSMLVWYDSTTQRWREVTRMI